MESFSNFEKSFAKKKKKREKLTRVRDADCLRTANSCRFEGVNTKGSEKERQTNAQSVPALAWVPKSNLCRAAVF